MTRFFRFTLLFLLLLAPAGAARAAQQDPVSLDVRAGYDGSGQYHVGHWFPVSLVAANDGGDLRGTIEWRFPGDSSPSFRYEIDLPRGARKQVRIPVVTNTSARAADLRLMVDGAPLLSRSVRLAPIDTSEVVVGVLSSDQTLLNSLGTAQLVIGYTTALSHLRADLLPEDATLLEGLDVIVIHDVAPTTLTASQRGALERWVRLGGTLLVSGGPDAARTAGDLGDLLPVQIGPGLRADVSTDSLERLAGSSGLSSLVQGITANQITPLPGARAIDRDGLIVAGAVGAGKVIFAAFDLAALRAWRGEPDLWGPILTIEDRMQMGYSFRWRSENLVRDTLQLASLKLPSPAILLLLIIVYIVVIGPVNFLVLRRIRRVDLAWITTPLLVAVFLLAAYGASFILRGTRPQLSQLALVQSFEGVPGGQATAFVSIFSPQRRSYTLGFAPEALVSPGTFESFEFSTIPVTISDSAVQVPDLLVDVSSLRTLLIEQPVAVTPDVESQLSRDASRVTGSLRNASSETLHNALIVSGDAAQSVGDIAPGDTVEVNLALNLQIFPDQTVAPSGALFNQQQVLATLFSYDRFAFGGPTFQGQQGLPERDAVYLLAWRSAPTITVAVDSDGELQKGLTLYLIRLNT
ncbi:hypothetical protein K2Z83_07300 [Oscillochloris sp. ZM17-4]|uniref:hypothetical protein n=1 Tax=Oscillochloris sp. ZM17-4 TaxID=2866714 RepID=UPI001C73DA0F|nr:hypothetical protein [Oscillochloris sp. ZM17-4]MBX0327483.1 hypothetical protein [Oscillochloris sp. ZM17-4]